MALLFHLNRFDDVKGKHDRIVKVSYRGSPLSSRILQDAGGEILVNETFEWPIARPMEAKELIKVELYNYNKFISNRLVGQYGIYCQELVQIGNIALKDYLTDSNNTMMKAFLEFEVTYHSPDGSVGEWNALGFDFPLYEPSLASVDILDGMERSIERSNDFDMDSLLSFNNKSAFGGSTYYLDYGATDETSQDGGQTRLPPPNLMQHVHRQFAPKVDKAFPKARHFQVGITIHEARQLNGLDIDPAIVVMVGDDQRCTNIRKATNCPFYNEYFAFDFEVPKEMFMDNVISISVIDANPLMHAQGVLKNYFQLGKIIGVHKIDVSHVWAEKGHQFVNKWAPLMDPKNFSSGNRGFVKCTIIAMSQANPMASIPMRTFDDDDFEKNLLLPRGVTFPRHPTRFVVKIYKARDLPRMDMGVMASIKKALTNENMALVDPCVSVTFGTVTEKTSVKSACYNPVWNQEITFTDLSPPLYKRIRVQLVDHNPLRDDVVATHYIPLAQISNKSKKHGFQPTFGPCWVNMYGTNRTYAMFDKHNYLNQGCGEGVAYRGALLMSVATVGPSGPVAGKFGAIVQPTSLISGLASGPVGDFFLYCTFLHATMIDAKLAGKPLRFEISIGNFGNQLDGVVSMDVPSIVSEEDDEEKEPLDRKPPPPKNLHSSTEPMLPETEDKIYYHMSFNEKKPSVFVNAQFEDQRKRLYMTNMLEKITERMEKGINEIEEVTKRELNNYSPHMILKDLLQKVSTDCNAFVNSVSGSEGRAAAGQTPLDKERIKLYKRKMTKIVKTLRKMRVDCKKGTAKEMLLETRKIMKKIRRMAIEPQHGLPDVFIWMLCGGKRVASVRVPSKEILFSNIKEETGKYCGKVQVLLLKLAGKDATLKSGWVMQAKLFVYMWLGLNKHRQTFMEGLPAGYESTKTISKARTNLKADPPTELIYKESNKFELRAHLYQARSLLGSDETGLSDPYVRVFCGKKSGRSHYLRATLCPTWNETIVLERITFHFNLEYLVKEPPPVVVECFDKDFLGTDEYIGRMMIKPEVITLDQSYAYPRLIWWPLWRSRVKAGEILAAFELIQLNDKDEVPENIPKLSPPVSLGKKMEVIRIPKAITPNITHTYRCEVMFWGVRSMSRVRFMQVNNPFFVLEFAGKTITSSVITDTVKTLNFKDPVCYVDVQLPDDKTFHPPITLLCNGSIAFGGKVLIGSYALPNVEKFFVEGEKEPEPELPLIVIDDGDGVKKAFDAVIGKPLSNLVTLPSNLMISMPSLNLNFMNSSPNGDVKELLVEGNNQQQPGAKPNGDAPGPKDTLKPEDGEKKDKPKTAPSTPSKKTGKGKVDKKPDKKKVTAGSEKKDKNKGDDEEIIDWWSRYYASWAEKLKIEEDAALEAKKKEEAEHGPRNPIVKIDTSGGATKVADKFKKMGNFVKSKAGSKMEGVTNKGYEPDGTEEGEGEGEEEDEFPGMTEEEQEEAEYKLIEKFKIYDCPLEEVPEFSEFTDRFVSFPILRGKIAEEEEDEMARKVGSMKGRIMIYKLLAGHKDEGTPRLKLSKFLPSSDPIGVMVRVYVIKATDLHPADIDNRADPFLIVKLGTKEEKDDNNYIANQLNPVFGRAFSFNAKLPHDNILTVQVVDYDQFSANDLIGETKIDIENRFYSKHRGTCGLKQTYDIFGYNQWQDPEQPTAIVDRFCVEYDLERPVYNIATKTVTFCGHTFSAEAEIIDEMGVVKPTKEFMALEILHHWEEIMPGSPLVPEHIETRPLYSPEHPGVEQGRLEMWVDIFNMELPPPGPPITITPRKPVSYELRCTVWNTADVVLNDTSLLSDQKSSDIYVKGWMDLMPEEMQETDVHYRSITGDGMFNWRFVYQFDWFAAEKKMMVKRKDGIFDNDIEEVKLPARFNLQVFDADMISSDDCLGALVMVLNKMPRGAKSSKMCTLKMLDKDAPMCNLFKLRKMKGWWPVTAKVKVEEEETEEGKEPAKPTKEPEEVTLIQGKIEAEFHLLPAEDAEQSPVGKARADPEPLPKPNRPDTSFGWFLNPWTLFKKVIWKKLKWIIIKSFIAMLFIALIVLFIYASPGYMVKKILGA